MTSWFAPSDERRRDLACIAQERDTEDEGPERLPPALRRVGRRLPDQVPNDLPHGEVAAAVRREPGVWFALDNWPTLYGSPISTGRIAPYRPAGAYQAVVRGHKLYIRYMGEGGEQDDRDGYARGRSAA